MNCISLNESNTVCVISDRRREMHRAFDNHREPRSNLAVSVFLREFFISELLISCEQSFLSSSFGG